MSRDEHSSGIVLIAGASGHIGPGIASVLARDGYRLVLCGRRPTPLEQIRKALPGADGHLVEILDFMDVTAVRALAERLDAADAFPFGLVHCIGPIRFVRSAVPPSELWREMWEGNVMTAVHLLGAFLPGLMDRGVGRVVLLGFSGVDARRGFTSVVPYAAAKEALASLMRSAAKAAAHRGVTVNMVSPGVIVRSQRGVTKTETTLLPKIPAGRFGTPDDIAHAVRWLLSPKAAYITGQNIKVSGGLHISP